MVELADVGLIGLGVMGKNLALNMCDHGYCVAVFNRTAQVTDDFVRANASAPGGLVPTRTLSELVGTIAPPRRVVIMVPAGPATDAMIDQLLSVLSKGDCIVDGGNAHWELTAAREARCAGRGVLYVGSGVSGGEEGARFGPSLMPGGSADAYALIEPIWTKIAAKVDRATGRAIVGSKPGKPVTPVDADSCSAHIGPSGAGHFVKMVHNGIEYADMQMIAETTAVLGGCLGLSAEEMAGVFEGWNAGELDSFLIEITAMVLRQRDPRDSSRAFVDVVLDAAGQKGTGSWTGQAALELGVAAPTIAEAVFARSMSGLKEQRVRASRVLRGPEAGATLDRRVWIDRVRDALYCSKICAYAQGFALIRAMSDRSGWGVGSATLARIWRGGCIIRARLLQTIAQSFDASPNLENLLIDPTLARELSARQGSWRTVVAEAMARGMAVPALSSALCYYDGYRSARLPASVIQAQRDCFGSHTYERVDEPRGKFFHIEWQNPGRPERAM